MKLPRLAVFWLLLGWLLVALYPNPSLLARSIANFKHPDINGAAVESLAATLPDDPSLIEEAVLQTIVPYEYDWHTAGVPWYFPTVEEVLSAGRGDCESRAIVLASLLEAKGLPHQLLMSFDHIWVDYPGKVQNSLENTNLVIAASGGAGFAWTLPAHFDLGAEIAAQIATFWTPMPTWRRLLLFAGILLVLFLNPLLQRRVIHSAAM